MSGVESSPLSEQLILQPQLFTALAALSWAQCLYYGGKKTKLFVALSYLTFMSLFGGIQTGLVFAFKVRLDLIPSLPEIYKLLS